ncbi:MAG: hypothetical protein ACFFER_19465 [Candidatus Thorarchaeota archaeon]
MAQSDIFDMGRRRDYIIAFLDLLGVPDDAAEAGRDILNLQTLFLRCLENLGMKDNVIFMGFSDSLFVGYEVGIYNLEDTFPTRGVDFLKTLCNLQKATWALKLPLRGGVSFGECYVLYQPRLPIVAGRPMRDAYQHEQNQKWIGISIVPDTSVEPRFRPIYDTTVQAAEDDNIIIQYDVPVSTGFENLWALNWLDEDLEKLESDMEQERVKMQAISESIASKYEATRNYARWLARQGGRTE